MEAIKINFCLSFRSFFSLSLCSIRVRVFQFNRKLFLFLFFLIFFFFSTLKWTHSLTFILKCLVSLLKCREEETTRNKKKSFLSNVTIFQMAKWNILSTLFYQLFHFFFVYFLLVTCMETKFTSIFFFSFFSSFHTRCNHDRYFHWTNWKFTQKKLLQRRQNNISNKKTKEEKEREKKRDKINIIEG